MAIKKNTAQKFETSLKDLEEIVRELENSQIDLDDHLKLYEKPIRLIPVNLIDKACLIAIISQLLGRSLQRFSIPVGDGLGINANMCPCLCCWFLRK